MENMFKRSRARPRDRGSTSVISLIVLMPVMAVLIMGVSWLSHMEAAQAVVEEAAREGARYLASHPGCIQDTKDIAANVIYNSTNFLSNKAGAYDRDKIALNNLCNDPYEGDSCAPSGDPLRSPRTDGYAYCRATYYYPVPLYNLWIKKSSARRPSWGAKPPDTFWQLTGEAFYVSGEAGY